MKHSFLCSFWWNFRGLGAKAQEFSASWQVSLFAAVGKKTVMPDAHEGIREHVKKEPADELISVYRQLLALVAISTISIPKGDQIIFGFHYSMVGDGDTMSVAAKVVQHLLGIAERRLGVNNPVLLPELADQVGKSLW